MRYQIDHVWGRLPNAEAVPGVEVVNGKAFVTINTLEEMQALVERVGKIIVYPATVEGSEPLISIYDGHIE